MDFLDKWKLFRATESKEKVHVKGVNLAANRNNTKTAKAEVSADEGNQCNTT